MSANQRLSAVCRHLVPQNTVAGPQKILQGYKVVELATVVAGPTAAAMLADLGASVIKVENPDRPDEVRGYDGETAATAKPGGLFQQYNRGKRGITLNIQKPGGIAVLKQLLADADVFVTNVRLHSLKKLGLDYDSLKNEFPQLVYGQLSAWGLQGEKAKDPGYDFGAFWAYSGVMEAIRSSADADMPRFPGAIGDSLTAMQLVMGISLALLDRTRTGAGQFVDAALLRSGIFGLSFPIIAHTSGGDRAVKGLRATMAIGERQTGLTAGCFKCADDKWVYLLGNEQWRHWDKTMAALGVSKFHFGDPAGKEAPKPDYRQSTAEVDAIIREKTYDEWHGIFEAHDVWHAPVNKFEDMYGDEQANAVGTFVDVPGLDHKLIALPVKLSSQEGLAGPVMGAPKLGEHTDEVLGELGIGLKDIQQLRKEGVTK